MKHSQSGLEVYFLFHLVSLFENMQAYMMNQSLDIKSRYLSMTHLSAEAEVF